MQNSQKTQKVSNSFNAGRHAYMIGVDQANNPYSKEPDKSSWEKGWIKESGRFIKSTKKVDRR